MAKSARARAKRKAKAKHQYQTQEDQTLGTQPTAPNSKHFRLMDLPTELRWDILEYYLAARPLEVSAKLAKKRPPIFRVSRQLRQDAIKLYRPRLEAALRIKEDQMTALDAKEDAGYPVTRQGWMEHERDAGTWCEANECSDAIENEISWLQMVGKKDQEKRIEESERRAEEYDKETARIWRLARIMNREYEEMTWMGCIKWWWMDMWEAVKRY